jgi:DNA-binding response OmpR family regulator
MLTSRDSVDDRVEGLDAGADDYLAKPFALRELYARLRAMLRTRPRSPQQSDRTGVPLLTMDVEHRQLRVGDEVVAVRPKEALLLDLLIDARGALVPRWRLLDRGWADADDATDNRLDVTIGRLRRRLSRLTGATVCIETVRGSGYRLTVGAAAP